MTDPHGVTSKMTDEELGERFKNNADACNFVKFGQKLLEDSSKPNVITVEQFMPFIDLFNVDKKRMETDNSYKLYLSNLLSNYRLNLGINLYQPTIVVASNDDPTEVVTLNRAYTPILSDNAIMDGMRDTVPSALPVNHPKSHEVVLMEASALDIINANQTSEQKDFFRRIQMESAIIQKRFYENNMSETRRKEIETTMRVEENESDEDNSSGTISYEIDDDD